jgi:hypothetical protein
MKRIGYILFWAVLTFSVILSSESYAEKRIKLWYIDGGEKYSEDYLIYKDKDIEDAMHTPQGILNLLFKDTKEIEPTVILVKNGVAYVNIKGDHTLITNRSGMTGAWFFVAEVVFNLTEFDDINYVYFVDEGAHFSPGKYERIDFWRLMTREEKKKYKEYIEDKLNAKREDVARYVRLLKGVGDEDTIKELRRLKEQLKVVDYGGCLMDEEGFKSLIDDTIKIIQGNKL